VNRVQKLRKTSGLGIEDEIEVQFETRSDYLRQLVTENLASINATLKVPVMERPAEKTRINSGMFEHNDETLAFDLYWRNK
jgi:hypothetical protein